MHSDVSVWRRSDHSTKGEHPVKRRVHETEYGDHSAARITQTWFCRKLSNTPQPPAMTAYLTRRSVCPICNDCFAAGNSTE